MSINLLSMYTGLNLNVHSISAHGNMNMNNNTISNIADGVRDSDVATVGQLRLLSSNSLSITSSDPMIANADISSYNQTNTNAVLLYNPQNSNHWIKLPLPADLNGMQLTILNVSTGSGVLSLCTDSYSTSLKDIPPNDNGLKLLAFGGRWIFLLI